MRVSQKQWIEYLVARDAHDDSEAKQITVYANQCWRDLELFGVVLVDEQTVKDRIEAIEKEEPKNPKDCPVCGGKMKIQAFGGGKESWACSTVNPIGTGFESEEWKHYEKSRREIHRPVFSHGELSILKEILGLPVYEKLLEG